MVWIKILIFSLYRLSGAASMMGCPGQDFPACDNAGCRSLYEPPGDTGSIADSKEIRNLRFQFVIEFQTVGIEFHFYAVQESMAGIGSWSHLVQSFEHFLDVSM